MADSPQQGRLPVERIVSGGQTGVDEGTLRAAIELGLDHGGWCPRGRRNERGRIASCFALRETATSNYAERTRLNVRDADATLILHRGPLRGGTRLTLDCARERGKPWWTLDLERDPLDLESVRTWLHAHSVRVLNVAGPRESSCPGIGEAARRIVLALMGGRSIEPDRAGRVDGEESVGGGAGPIG